MKFRDHSNTARAEIHLAPMIDVVFLLLIFFIVSWNFVRFESVEGIEVPEADQADQSGRKPGEIVVNIDQDGQIIVGGIVVSQDDLTERLTALASQHEDTPIIVRGDRRTKYSDILKIMRACEEAKIFNLNIAAMEPPENPQR